MRKVHLFHTTFLRRSFSRPFLLLPRPHYLPLALIGVRGWRILGSCRILVKIRRLLAVNKTPLICKIETFLLRRWWLRKVREIYPTFTNNYSVLQRCSFPCFGLVTVLSRVWEVITFQNQKNKLGRERWCSFNRSRTQGLVCWLRSQSCRKGWALGVLV